MELDSIKGEIKMSEETKTPEGTEETVSPEAKDHFGKARDEFKKGLDSMFPPEVKEHRQAAQKEVLLGLRSLIDAALERFTDEE
jgi:hypothetical protein